MLSRKLFRSKQGYLQRNRFPGSTDASCKNDTETTVKPRHNTGTIAKLPVRARIKKLTFRSAQWQRCLGENPVKRVSTEQKSTMMEKNHKESAQLLKMCA